MGQINYVYTCIIDVFVSIFKYECKRICIDVELDQVQIIYEHVVLMDLFKKYVFYVFCVFAMGIIDMFDLLCFFIP